MRDRRSSRARIRVGVVEPFLLPRALPALLDAFRLVERSISGPSASAESRGRGGRRIRSRSDYGPILQSPAWLVTVSRPGRSTSPSRRSAPATTPTRTSTSRASSCSRTAAIRTSHAGVPEAATRSSAGSTRRSRSLKLRARTTGTADARGARALRRRRDRAVGDRADDRGRLHAVRPPRDGLPRRARAPDAHLDNVRRVVDAAAPKSILFFPARHDHWLVQTGDGYAAHVSGRDRRLDGRAVLVVGRARDRHGAARADRLVRRRHRARDEAFRRLAPRR